MKAPLTKDSSLSLFSHFIFQIYSKFDSNLMLSDSNHHHCTVEWLNITFFVVFLSVSGASGATPDEKIQEKLSDLLPCWPQNSSNPDSSSQTRVLDLWADLLETLGVFSALSRERGSSDRPQLVRTGLPLTTGKLSGVWERTPAVSTELAAPTR